MPHVELKYSNDLPLDPETVFNTIETTINNLDSSAGACKSRAYPASHFKHTHIMIFVWLLQKKHRDNAFSKNLLATLTDEIKKLIPIKCYFSLKLYYMDENYITLQL